MILMLSAGSLGTWAQVGVLTQTGDMTVCQNSTEPYGVMPTAGSSYTWSIIAGSGGAGSITNGLPPNNLISVNWTSSGTCTLQVIETSATCTGIPVNIQVTVLPALVPGIASADQTINVSVTPAPISSTPPTGGNGTYTYQWEYSIDGGTTWVIAAGATSLTYAPGALTQTTQYHLIQASGTGCSSVTTNIVTINVQNPLVAGTATADQTICYNGTPAPITSTAPTGGNGIYAYQWESSIDGGSTWVIVAGATNLTHAPGALTQTTKYHLIQTPEVGYGSVTTNNVTLTVQPQLITSPIYHN
ncbi:MAG: hypothetical protein D4R64_17455 [Porphyromonadaceae bacterium]|nr:MAG: hypothetical protein D4R64_17455 [Porphyromonadaceae bacterium]